MDVIVIGGGAAGMVAAIKSAREGNKVTIIEKEKKLGQKILVTGNGRCNLTNLNLNKNIIDEWKYLSEINDSQSGLIKEIVSQYDVYDVIDFFKSIGLYSRKNGELIYPLSNRADSVLMALNQELSDLKVKIKTNNIVKSIHKEDDKFIVDVGFEYKCHKLIITTGGKSAPKTGSDGSGFKLINDLGINVTEMSPSLCGVIIKNNPLFKASGVRVNGEVSINGTNILDVGEVQITDYGVSGIPIFNISRFVDEKSVIKLRIYPDKDKFVDNDFNIYETFKSLVVNNSDKPVLKIMTGLFDEKLAKAILDINGYSDSVKCSEIIIDSFILTEFDLQVEELRDFDNSQVTKGGIDLNEIDFTTMESKKIKNLYFAGEVLDIDGPCGGYNLHFAWASGLIAGGK